MSSQPKSVRALLTTIAILFGIIVGLVAGILQSMNHTSIPSAIEYGCAAFVGGVLFLFGIINFCNNHQNRGS
jgi:hypothetical protein